MFCYFVRGWGAPGLREDFNLEGEMGAFPHQRLIVYAKALECCAGVYRLAAQLPRAHWHMKDQIERAASSILLNIAEGAGEFSPDDKARFFRIARRSASEVSAGFDLMLELNLISGSAHAEVQTQLQEIAATLTRLVQVTAARNRVPAPERRAGRRTPRRPPSTSTSTSTSTMPSK